MEDDERAIPDKRDKLQALPSKAIPGLVINGDTNHRLAGISTFQFQVFQIAPLSPEFVLN
jgi:hypothetical protein